MSNANHKKLKAPDEYLRELISKISERDRFAFLCGFLMCLAVNLFVYTNTCFVHDSLQLLDTSTGIENGRLLVGPMLGILNRMQLPWLIGITDCMLSGMLVVYLAKIFKLSGKLNMIILSGIMVTSDTVVLMHLFFGSSYIYLTSLLLSVLAVYYTDRKHGYALAVVLLCLSLFMYQAYIATAMGLYIFMLIIKVYEDKHTDKQYILLTLKYAAICIVSMALYYIIWKLVLKLTGTNMIDYNAYSDINTVPSLNELVSRFGTALSISICSILSIISYKTYFLTFINIFLAAGMLAFTILNTKKRKGFIYIFIYLFAYVFSVSVLTFISGDALHGLTAFSVVLVPIFLLYLCENFISAGDIKKVISWFTSVLCIVLILGQAVYANSLYLKVKVNYDNSWSYCTRIVDRIEQTEGFNENSKIVIVNYDNGVHPYKQNEKIKDAISYPLQRGMQNTYVDSFSGITSSYKLKWFIEQEMDMSLNLEANEEEIMELQEVKNMGSFPDNNSVKWVGDTLVVRIG